MSAESGSKHRPHVLLYEPRVEGHHVSYLKFITEDLLGAGYRVSAAVDTRPEAMERIRAQIDDLLPSMNILPCVDPGQSQSATRTADTVGRCFKASNAKIAFINSFDEIASSMLRKAAFGKLPPASLRGVLGGIYLRPRFALSRGFSVNNWWKAAGFNRLTKGGWLNQLLLLDPFLTKTLQGQHRVVPFTYLPDPYPDSFNADSKSARQQLDVPEDKFVFLFYGGAYRRKGLPLAVDAMTKQKPESPAYLLCAGRQNPGPPLAQTLERLAIEGKARVINRYVSAEEEKLLFAASDVVLLPYINHFGSSGVLARAAGAGRPVIASDEELVGQLVREHKLGWLFPSGDAGALASAIEKVTRTNPVELSELTKAVNAYAPLCSRAAFRNALLGSFANASNQST